MSETLDAISRKPGWEHFPHAADIGVRGFGRTVADAFEQAALALTAVVTTAEIRPSKSVEVKCDAPDAFDPKITEHKETNTEDWLFSDREIA
ncbi:MAG TPA: archease [Pseudolabrys sp.]|nr:archease [Pseudolabrys sp.]